MRCLYIGCDDKAPKYINTGCSLRPTPKAQSPLCLAHSPSPARWPVWPTNVFRKLMATAASLISLPRRGYIPLATGSTLVPPGVLIVDLRVGELLSRSGGR